MTGKNNFNYGRCFSESHRKKIGLAAKGRIPWNKGKKTPKHSIDKIKKKLIGRKAWNKGISMSDETKKKLSASLQNIRLEDWSGFKSTEDRLERIKFRNEVQKLIFERDNYTCQICGQVGGNLQVDHIQSWADYVELRFDMDNCRTLCMECHYFITFGKPKPKVITNWGNNLSGNIGRKDLK